MIDFKLISIRGRVAFALECFKKLLSYNNINSNNSLLESFVETLWSFCENYEIEKYEAYINEIAPYSILDEHPDNDFSDLEYISKEQAIFLKEYYSNLPEDLINVMNNLTEIAFGNLYGSTGNYSQITLKPLYEIISICEHHDVDLNSIKIDDSMFNEEKG